MIHNETRVEFRWNFLKKYPPPLGVDEDIQIERVTRYEELRRTENSI